MQSPPSPPHGWHRHQQQPSNHPSALPKSAHSSKLTSRKLSPLRRLTSSLKILHSKANFKMPPILSSSNCGRTIGKTAIQAARRRRFSKAALVTRIFHAHSTSNPDETDWQTLPDHL